MAAKLHALLCRQFTKTTKLQTPLCISIHHFSSDMSGRISANSSQHLRRIFGCSALQQHPNAYQSSITEMSKLHYSTSGFLSSLREKLGFRGRMRYPKYILLRSALGLYLNCVELVDHDLFLREFGMQDTFNSWFRITELHIWLCMVRLAQEGKEGIFLRNSVVNFMWEDVENKTKKLSANAASTAARRAGVQELNEQFRAALFGYDEGLLSDDKALAGALWRNFFDKNCKDAEHLEKMVDYVRRQVHTIGQMESNVMLTSGVMGFSPLYETQEAFERNKQILVTIMKRL